MKDDMHDRRGRSLAARQWYMRRRNARSIRRRELARDHAALARQAARAKQKEKVE